MRDIRDPKLLGEELLRYKRARLSPLSLIYDEFKGFPNIPDWTGDGFMSSNPAEHHSKVKQQPGGRRDYW